MHKTKSSMPLSYFHLNAPVNASGYVQRRVGPHVLPQEGVLHILVGCVRRVEEPEREPTCSPAYAKDDLFVHKPSPLTGSKQTNENAKGIIVLQSQLWSVGNQEIHASNAGGVVVSRGPRVHEEPSSVTYRFSHRWKGSGVHLQNVPYVGLRLEDCDRYFSLINGRFDLTSFVPSCLRTVPMAVSTSGRERDWSVRSVTSTKRNGEKRNHTAYEGGHCITLGWLEPSSLSVAC